MEFGGRGDTCISIFAEVWATGALVIPPNAAVLEIGCAEADWMSLLAAARPDVQLTGIDWRAAHKRPGAFVRGDVLTHDFPDESFDFVVGISSIEHVGLGHYDHDPVDADGDLHCVQRVARWLKPGGLFYADVPYAVEFRVHGTEHRCYDDVALTTRLLGPLTERGRWYANWQGHLCAKPETVDPHLMSYVALLAVKE